MDLMLLRCVIRSRVKSYNTNNTNHTKQSKQINAMSPFLLVLSFLLHYITFLDATNISMCLNESDWNITFHDDFNGNQLNTSNWKAVNNQTHGTTEKQLYLSNNVKVANGTLIITTKKQTAYHTTNNIYNITSGWVESKHKQFQTYGRFEVRAKLPSTLVGEKGKWPSAWPAHWLMPENGDKYCWPTGGEIDIMEGYRPTKSQEGSVLMTYHWADQCGKDLYAGHNDKFPNASNTTIIDWTNEWHTFGVEWTESSIKWYIDGVLKHIRVSGQPQSLFVPSWDFYMILNTAMTPWSDANKVTGLPSLHIIDRVTWCQPITQQETNDKPKMSMQ